MLFDGPCLRLLTPETINGEIPKMENGKIVYREDFVPLTARKQFEKKNAWFDKIGKPHLKRIIEVVGLPEDDNREVIEAVAAKKSKK